LQDALRKLAAMSLRAQLLILGAAFGGATLVAELAGAANLGTAMAFGQIAFVVALVATMLRA
jgi:superfamily II helicase